MLKKDNDDPPYYTHTHKQSSKVTSSLLELHVAAKNTQKKLKAKIFIEKR